MNENNAAQAAQKDWDAAVSAANLAPATGHVVLNAATVLNIAALLSKLRAPVSSIREGFELTYAADADDPACASDLSHFTNGWRACVMSQVRAPVADERAALQKLVDLEDMRLRLRALHENGHGTDYDHYHKALPAAWKAARAALASAPVAPTTDRAMLQSVLQDLEKSESVCPRCGHSDSCADMDVAYMIRDHLKGDASAPVAPEACPTDVCQAGQQDGVLCANDECDRANGVRPASAPVAEPRLEWSAKALYDAIKDVLLNHRLSNWVDGDGESFPLVDHLCSKDAKTTESGEFEIALICDAIYNDVLTKSAPVAGEAQPSDADITNTIRALDDQARYTRDVDGEMGVRVKDVMIARAVLARYGHTPLPMADAAPQASECECSRKSKAVSDSEAQL